jgi:hypothetical protein
VFQCANCCDSQADESCCLSAARSTCCSKTAVSCCLGSRLKGGEDSERPPGCGCGERDEPRSETPLPAPPSAERVFESLAALSLTTRDCRALQPQLERIAFERSPAAHSAPPPKQLLLCVWRT